MFFYCKPSVSFTLPTSALKVSIWLLATIFNNTLFSQPVITSFAPVSAALGTSVIINGFNFGPINDNIVHFGAVRATVTAASSTAITVLVPAGATYQPISVSTNKLTAYSTQAFITKFDGGGAITSSSFARSIDSATGDMPYSMVVNDIDEDGRPDIIVVNGGYPYSISIFRNTSTSHKISFASKVNFATDASPHGLAVGDVDGDGYPDVIITNTALHVVSVFKNKSSPGFIDLYSRIDFPTGAAPFSVNIGDIDGDGKPDLVTTNFTGQNISIIKNTSVNNVISFAAKKDYPTGIFPISVAIRDFNSDGKPDIVIANQGQRSITIFKNVSTPGNIAVLENGEYITGVNPYSIAVGDVNGDGKPDIAVANAGSATVSIYGNVSASGNISFNPRTDVAVGDGPVSVSLSDIDGDGKPDIGVASENNKLVTLRNSSADPLISFDEKTDFTVAGNPSSIFLSDLNTDGKPDIIVANLDSGTISILENTVDLPNVSSFTPGSAPSGTTVTITGTNLNDVSSVLFGGTKATSFNIVNATTIKAVVGSGSDGSISVISPKGIGSRTGFIYLPPPSINSFNPAEGEQGTKVSILGANFTGTIAVSFGNIPAASFNVDSSTGITAILGNGATGSITVTTPYGSATSASFSFVLPKPVPTINSFVPISGPVGSKVIITGTNFSSVASENIVYFGSVTAEVIESNTNSLIVKVPSGTTFQPITVTVGFRTASSKQPFSISFPGALNAFTSHSMETRKKFRDHHQSTSITLGDFDGDGKPDLASVNTYAGNSRVSILKNTSQTGRLSFAAEVEFQTGTVPYDITVGDLNSDGKLDIVTANDNSTVSILINSSTGGVISFAPKVELLAISHTQGVAIGDIDGDGRPDIAVVNTAQATLSIYRNMTVSGNKVSFSSDINFATGNTPTSVSIADFDGDGKMDIVVSNQNAGTVSAYRNLSTIGNIILSPRTDFISGALSNSLSISDLDGDGKPDITVSNLDLYTNRVSILRNKSSQGNISFDVKVSYPTGNSPLPVAIDDLDGDGKPDIVVGSLDDYSVSLLKNKSTNGIISFDDKVDLQIGPGPLGLCLGDIDGDGKPDIIAVNNSEFENTIAILRNAVTEPLIIPSGANPVKGYIYKKITIDTSVQTRDGSAYVQRHYDIEPETNPSIATATITLYYTQQEFDNFNLNSSHNLHLPENPTDSGGIAAVRVLQYHGLSTTSLPESYMGTATELNPKDENIIWNNRTLGWEVTFDVTGFSGFFLGSVHTIVLPQKLLSFTVKEQGIHPLLQWTTGDKINMAYFDLQRSNNAISFYDISLIPAANNNPGIHSYQYKDTINSSLSNYYRLKMVDISGDYIYSDIVTIRSTSNNSLIKIYPNPAKNNAVIEHPLNRTNAQLQVVDITGKLVKIIKSNLNSTRTEINLRGISSGVYKLLWVNGTELLSQTLMIEK